PSPAARARNRRRAQSLSIVRRQSRMSPDRRRAPHTTTRASSASGPGRRRGPRSRRAPPGSQVLPDFFQEADPTLTPALFLDTLNTAKAAERRVTRIFRPHPASDVLLNLSLQMETNFLIQFLFQFRLEESRELSYSFAVYFNSRKI